MATDHWQNLRRLNNMKLVCQPIWRRKHNTCIVIFYWPHSFAGHSNTLVCWWYSNAQFWIGIIVPFMLNIEPPSHRPSSSSKPSLKPSSQSNQNPSLFPSLLMIPNSSTEKSRHPSNLPSLKPINPLTDEVRYANVWYRWDPLIFHLLTHSLFTVFDNYSPSP